ncbi:hypothetical protein K488DRAFT_70661 [Vararia minispora EC-137]|uniref:Uncharacterized protein n=1 Tax=Vararia minispora EC-137 TaxID=1314806 RepID=A0ACB8QLE1_9AGAM|nr:hypothetical protein K488DRAFT_70661 [Vararia minispora EC-137]
MQILTVVVSAAALATGAMAEAIHLRFAASATSLVAPFYQALVVLPCGTSNATSSDLTKLVVSSSTPGDEPTQIVFGGSDMCVTSAGASPASDVNFVKCGADAEQRWTFESDGMLKDADGTCITIGRAGPNAPVCLIAPVPGATVSDCGEFPEKQQWVVERL